jgi:hypothetical protein
MPLDATSAQQSSQEHNPHAAVGRVVGHRCPPHRHGVASDVRALCIHAPLHNDDRYRGAAVDASAKIAFNGKRYASVAHSATLDGQVVSDIYILTPAEPTCAQPAGTQSAAGIAYDPASYSPTELDRLLGR